MKRAILSVLLLVFMTGCVMYIVRYEGSFKGWIVDAETREPIEGVVVLGVWFKKTWTIAGGIGRYYDARETVTNERGEFSLPGKTIRIFSNLEPVHLTIFKAGYNHTGGTVASFKSGKYYSEKIKWEGNRLIIPLRKLTMEERKKRGEPPYPTIDAPSKKVILMMTEINKNRIELGMNPIDIWGGEKIWED